VSTTITHLRIRKFFLLVSKVDSSARKAMMRMLSSNSINIH